MESTACKDGHEATCHGLLSETTNILDQFMSRLRALYTNTKQPLLPQLEQLFPEKNFIDHELKIFQTLLDKNIFLYLEKLLEYWKNDELINHICKGCIALSEHYKISLGDHQPILENVLNIARQTSIETCSERYQAYCTNYSRDYSESTLKLIAHWSLSEELLKFLFSLQASDVDDLLEVVNEYDETLINTQTVLDFVLLKRFLNQLDIMVETISKNKSLELNDAVTCFQKSYSESEFKNILNNFETCSKCLSSLKYIFMASNQKEQSARNRILTIMKNSKFCFCVHQLKGTVHGSQYQFDVHIVGNNWKPVSFHDLSELRDRARLIQYGSNKARRRANHVDDNLQQLRSFVSLTETLETILELFTSLHTAGFPLMQEDPVWQRKFSCTNSNYSELDKFKSDLETQLVDWEKQLCIVYKKCIYLTYFSYQQIWMVENFLYGKKFTTSNDAGYHLLKFIGIEPQNIRSEFLPERSKIPKERLQNMAQILNIQHPTRNLPIQENYQRPKTVFLVETSNKGILRAIYSIFNCLNSNNSNKSIVANQLFYCTKNANWTEIRAFIYRCFYSQTLQQLIRPESLSLVIQDKFTKLLNQLIEEDPKHFFLLGIITTVSNSQLHIINSLRIHGIIQMIHEQDMISDENLYGIIQPVINDCSMLVTSAIAGLGKSTYIQNQSRQLTKTCVKFPISGDIGIDTLVERLYKEDIHSTSSEIVIHIDIGPVEDVQQLSEFLYCLVVFRCFRLRQVPIHVSSSIPIYIELDSSSYLTNQADDIVVFKYLNVKHFDSMNWNELDISRTPAIPFVAYYLKCIEDQTIINKNIDEENIENPPDRPTCIRLLKAYVLAKRKAKFTSWTQLSIFVSIYHKIFSSFSRCGHFSADLENLSSLRMDILTSLLNSSDQYTSLSVEAVRENQRAISRSEIILRYSEAIIRWDKTQPFTIIFTATDDPLFVYKTQKDIPPSLIDAFRSYYQLINEKRLTKQRLGRKLFSFFSRHLARNNNEVMPSTAKEQLQDFLTDHDKMTHEQFFFRLTSLSTKYVSRKSICEKCFHQCKYDDQNCTICSATGLIRLESLNSTDIEDFQKKVAKKLESEYVLTADNYIKMLLICLRVYSGLPVLIMGETGKIIHCRPTFSPIICLKISSLIFIISYDYR